MPALATLDNIALRRPDGVPLFSGLSLAINAARYGLVGRNGSGKSSLLRVLAGETKPWEGHASVAGTVLLVDQDVDPAHQSVADVLGVTRALAILDRLAMGEGTAADASDADWTLEARLSECLDVVGLPGLDLRRSIASLSGGERIRLMLARALVERPDLLLLDEPTNNMDAAGRAAVAALLGNWRGAIVVASHDRTLLEGVDWIVELAAQGCHITNGGWSDHARARAERLDRAEKRLDRAQAMTAEFAQRAQARVERQARRGAKGRRERADGSQPKLVANARKEQAEATSAAGRRLAERQMREAEGLLCEARANVEELRPMSFALPPTGLPAGRRVLSVDNLMIHHRDGPTIGPVSFAITGPERLALTGRNGAGKTSILRAVAHGTCGPDGQIMLARPNPPMLDQHLSLLRADQTLRENMERLQPGLPRNDVHAALARFAFRNEDADRQAGTLSGGEKLRAALACVFASASPPDLLILDEPTNHLDIDSVEELETALNGYDGALLVVSHDDGFLERIGIETQIILS